MDYSLLDNDLCINDACQQEDLNYDRMLRKSFEEDSSCFDLKRQTWRLILLEAIRQLSSGYQKLNLYRKTSVKSMSSRSALFCA